MGYSTNASADWRNPSILDVHYAGIQDNNATYYDRSTTATVWENTKTWKSLTEKRDPSAWEKKKVLTEPNATYYGTNNAVRSLIFLSFTVH